MQQETLLAQAGVRRDASTGAIASPIHLSAAFQHPALGQSTGFDYSRTGNPTRQVLEETLALLDGGSRAAAFSSGLAAIDAVLRIFTPGDALVVTEDVYGGSFRLFEQFGTRYGLSFHYVDTSDAQAVEEALALPGVAGLFVEMPTNPLLKVADVPSLAAMARKRHALTIVDNTFLTPALFRPLEHGADIAVYSATKYLGGHNDLIAGLAVTNNAAIGERLAFIQNATGAVLSPFDSWLLLRSLKTLRIRLARQQETALDIARFLQGHPAVRRVYYPGLPTDPGFLTLSRHCDGSGAMLSAELDSPQRAKQVLAAVNVFLFAESLGGAESLVTYPLVQTHADMKPELLARVGITDCLLRFSIGLEDVQDLQDDLEAALA